MLKQKLLCIQDCLMPPFQSQNPFSPLSIARNKWLTKVNTAQLSLYVVVCSWATMFWPVGRLQRVCSLTRKGRAFAIHLQSLQSLLRPCRRQPMRHAAKQKGSLGLRPPPDYHCRSKFLSYSHYSYLGSPTANPKPQQTHPRTMLIISL